MSKKKDNKIVIEAHTKFQRKDDKLLITEVDGEKVIMNTENGTYWGFNNTTTEIWNLLNDSISFEKIIEHLLNKFNVEEEVCKQETMKVLRDFCRLDVVNILPE